jgi:hypothetical protein
MKKKKKKNCGSLTSPIKHAEDEKVRSPPVVMHAISHVMSDDNITCNKLKLMQDDKYTAETTTALHGSV